MLTDPEKKAVLGSWRLVVPIADTAADFFYQRLFELAPEYRALFGEDLAAQKRKLVTMFSFIVKAMDWLDEDWKDEVGPEEDLCFVVLALGRRHANLYKVPDAAYETVGEALLWTLDQGLGQAFTPEVKEAWTKLYGLVATTMKVGARASRLETRLGEVA
jgi:hemoglobin-like flavoprotein